MAFVSQYKHPEIWTFIRLLNLGKGMRLSRRSIFQAPEQWEPPAIDVKPHAVFALQNTGFVPRRAGTVKWQVQGQLCCEQSGLGTQLSCYEELKSIFFSGHRAFALFLAVISVRAPILKYLKDNSKTFCTVFCIPLSSSALRQQTFPPFSSVAGDAQPSLQLLPMVTAGAAADQGTHKGVVAAVPLLRGSQFSSCWLWGHWEKYLLFFLCSIKFIFWLIQRIILSCDGVEQNKPVTSSDCRAFCILLCILPGWFNKG